MEWVSKLPANETDGIEAFMILNVENTKYSYSVSLKKISLEKDLPLSRSFFSVQLVILRSKGIWLFRKIKGDDGNEKR